MTATERLRALLDERGVEYETYHDVALTEVDAVFWQDHNGQPCSAIGNADDIPERMLSVQCVISPEQAVDATLGRGTCKIDYHFNEWYCTGCGETVGTSDPSSELCIDGNAIELWSFCPSCGRKVEA